jgi:hypothetical protein
VQVVEQEAPMQQENEFGLDLDQNQDYIDNRRHPRFMFEVDMQIQSVRFGILPGRSLELSESGISALIPAELLLDEIVDMELQLPFGPLYARALVRNRNVFRYGFEFVYPTNVQRELKDKLNRIKHEN